MGNARDVGFSLTGPVNWGSRTVQVVVTVNTVQEGCQAIADAVVEKRIKTRGPGCPHGMMKVTKAPTAAYNIEEWMGGLEEDVPKVEVRNGDAIVHGPEQRNAHSQHAGQGSRWHGRQGRPQFPRDTSSGVGSSDQGSN